MSYGTKYKLHSSLWVALVPTSPVTTCQELTRFSTKFPEMKGSCGPQGVGLLVWSVSKSVDCEGETFNKSALRRPSALLPLPAGMRRAATPALAIFEQNAQRIGIHDSGDDRDVKRLLLSYRSSQSSDRSLDAIATRMGENASPCTPWNPVAMGVTTPVLRLTRPTSFTTFAAV